METYERSNLRAQRSRDSAAGAGREAGASTQELTAVESPSATATEQTALRIAILDRDTGFLMVLAKRMERRGWSYRKLAARTSAKALTEIEADALILDITLLGPQRWKLLGRLCRERPDLALVVCTGSSTVAQRVCGLRLGADDWLTKPCHPEELIARVEAVTARRHRVEVRNLDPIAFGEVEVRPDQFQAFVHERSLQLTRREYQLIEVLARADGEVLARERVYECLWGGEMLRNDRSVDVFVHKLRRKLELASPQWRYIHTHFGIGYRLAAEWLDSREVGDLAHAVACGAEEQLAA